MCSVFVVDDDPIHHYLTEYLSRENKEIGALKSFYDPDKALQFLLTGLSNPQDLPDIILLDVNMPGIDGPMFLERFETLCELLQKDIKIFLLSSSSNSINQFLHKKYAFVKGSYAKPITKDILHELIHYHI